MLLCYGNQHPGAKVNYCAGMAYAATPKLALEKSVMELWQTLRFMQSVDSNNESKSELQDPYLAHFLTCNRYDTYLDISGFAELENHTHKERRTTPFTTKTLIYAIRNLRFNGYLYLSPPSQQSHLYICKYLSPNLFLHMNNAHHLNLENTYSRPFLNDVIISQLTRMVPFP
ncbi:hypothetical protein BR1R5_27020 [Pseudomonas sp. BR1R-5]|nr:hypothetical protein BR1R5_27020 [Pseudomonas sp. BR1R-5]